MKKHNKNGGGGPPIFLPAAWTRAWAVAPGGQYYPVRAIRGLMTVFRHVFGVPVSDMSAGWTE